MRCTGLLQYSGIKGAYCGGLPHSLFQQLPVECIVKNPVYSPDFLKKMLAKNVAVG